MKIKKIFQTLKYYDSDVLDKIKENSKQNIEYNFDCFVNLALKNTLMKEDCKIHIGFIKITNKLIYNDILEMIKNCKTLIQINKILFILSNSKTNEKIIKELLDKLKNKQEELINKSFNKVKNDKISEVKNDIKIIHRRSKEELEMYNNFFNKYKGITYFLNNRCNIIENLFNKYNNYDVFYSNVLLVNDSQLKSKINMDFDIKSDDCDEIGDEIDLVIEYLKTIDCYMKGNSDNELSFPDDYKISKYYDEFKNINSNIIMDYGFFRFLIKDIIENNIKEIINYFNNFELKDYCIKNDKIIFKNDEYYFSFSIFEEDEYYEGEFHIEYIKDIW